MSKLTFQEVTALWKADKRKWVKTSTYATYVQITNKHILPFFGPLSPDEMTEETIQRFADGMLAKGLSAHSVRDALMILKMILRYGEKIAAWPHIVYEVHFPTTAQPNSEIPVLSNSDQRKLLSHIQENFSFRNLGILICLYSGLFLPRATGTSRPIRAMTLWQL